MGIKKRQKTAVFDFDGVIASYKGWKGFDIFGKPFKEVIKTMKRLKRNGWRVIIFTTRVATPKLLKWLKKNDVPFDDINRDAQKPYGTSNKPIYDAIIDDRAVHYHGQLSKHLYKEIVNVCNQYGEEKIL